MKMDFGVGIGRALRIDEIPDHARVAEECGFSHLTFVDQPNLDRDVHVMMAMAVANTQRIRIGHGVIDPYTFRPWVIANATATLNELSGGRVFLGIGAGGEYGKAIKPRPLQELREAIQFIRKYMAGEEAAFQGVRMHSEWVSRPVPVYMACTGPRSCQLAGEIADGAIVGGVNPEKTKWHLELIEKGALKAGRDPSEIDVWARTLIYVAESKEVARREAASYAATWAYDNYLALFRRENPELVDLRRRLERVEPEIIGDLQRVYDAFDPYQHERTDAPHAQVVTQRVIDFFLLTGTPEDICEGINKLGELGVKTVSTVLFTIFDQKGMMREIRSKIVPHFRN